MPSDLASLNAEDFTTVLEIALCAIAQDHAGQLGDHLDVTDEYLVDLGKRLEVALNERAEV